MSRSEVEQEDLFRGYGFFETTIILDGTGAEKRTVIRGGKHPKMRMLLKEESTLIPANSSPTGDYSYTYALAFTTKNAILEVSHLDGDVAGVTIVATAEGDVCPFIESTAGADVFEADEDVIIRASTASNAASVDLVVLKFVPVN